jgi:hypothetical protein
MYHDNKYLELLLTLKHPLILTPNIKPNIFASFMALLKPFKIRKNRRKRRGEREYTCFRPSKA